MVGVIFLLIGFGGRHGTWFGGVGAEGRIGVDPVGTDFLDYKYLDQG